eukprot:TRINITY_DN16032_c0_g1::TRINITY_DN16032_c0_g1_i1::g.13759::m.13759 TRINITY_DN16032_c0_g1::TRINITY_DN16032_c0_g1_i1::g.13759  ORF type:complete len:190 (+),score=29.34,sp/Q3HRP5/CNBL2_ORYSJ/45.79/5e-48,EF-hand_1/PF00036.27/2.3e+03,EF-hand_1/PF00036.27/1.7,EF-hand_1/PF00036.27/1.3e-05,EF-hand_1/PF00036.27/7.9e-07,EF-hand_1/PF00036.27/1.3e-07,EF-hand_7/PF13499.1/9.3e-06,EF-hand_7/PF13499.1/4.1e-15,EF-hand_8/PF13833.1/55,EF-hand_8/PF13833.1/2.8e-09,EF-hand_8/PF13833.1/0.0023,EF-hand_8/PF13833.1/1.6e-
MGQKLSRTELKRRELGDFVKKTHFTIDEVRDLYKHFKTISSGLTDDGLIDKAEFKKALGLKDSLFVDRMFALFDENGDSVINFNEFIVGLSVFCPKGSLEEKLKFSFRIYDFDGDGHISQNELKQMLEASLVENHLSLSQKQIDDLVSATFNEADIDGDGKIDFEEYKRMVMRHPSMIRNMTIQSLGSS